MLFSIYMNFSETHISCCPAPTNRMWMLKAPYYNNVFHNNVSLHFELETKVIMYKESLSDAIITYL